MRMYICTGSPKTLLLTNAKTGVEIPCQTCQTHEILTTDKWNFPAELPADKRASQDEFTCVLALFSAPKFCEKEVPFKEGNAKFT